MRAVTDTENEVIVILRFIQFDLERGYDFLYIGNGDDSTDESSLIYDFTGVLSLRLLASKGVALWLVFDSDRSGTRQGFHIQATGIEKKSKYIFKQMLLLF